MKQVIDATQNQRSVPTSPPPAHSVLIVEDDGPLMQCLARAMETRGFKVTTAVSVADGLAKIKLSAPSFAVVDMRFDDGCGLDIISALKQQRPDARAIILTGYGNIATAVSAVKLGAVDYLAKPADADDVVSALLAPEGRKAEPPQHPMSADRVRWEHIKHVHEACGRNVSETARRLNMHRRPYVVFSLRHFRLASWRSLSLGGWWPRIRCGAVRAARCLLDLLGPAQRVLAADGAVAGGADSVLVLFRFGATLELGRSERTTMRPLWRYGVDAANTPDRKPR